MSEKQYSEKWQRRFAFYDAYGGPSCKEHKAAFKQLSFSERIAISTNWFAFFFSVFYYAYLGMWRKAISILVLYIAIVVVALVLGKVAIGGITLALFCAWTANPAYYLQEKRGSKSWNPFEKFTPKDNA